MCIAPEKPLRGIPVLPNRVCWPLPARLSSDEVLADTRMLNAGSFPTAEGRAQFRDLKKRGLTMFSWPDGVRALFRLPRGRRLSAAEALHAYTQARATLEKMALQMYVGERSEP